MPEQCSDCTQIHISAADAIRDALAIMLERDDFVVLIGEGVPDPKAIFNTTKELQTQFGKSRVFDMPLSENGVTGICVGAALTGLRPVMVHQRVDFAMLAMDQLINNAAKWHIMFGGQHKVPLVVRMIIGRGWGQGPQHSQSLQAIFSHIPGLKVVMPAFPEDAKGMLISAIEDDNPVIFMEHRWIHLVHGSVPVGYYKTPIDKAKVLKTGDDISIAGFSFTVIEALYAAKILTNFGVDAEVIDMRSCSPLDTETVINSVNKTGHLIAIDTGHISFGVLAELCTRITESCFPKLRSAPQRLASPDFSISTSHYASKNYYPSAMDIARKVLVKLGLWDEARIKEFSNYFNSNIPHDVPNPEYRGPF